MATVQAEAAPRPTALDIYRERLGQFPHLTPDDVAHSVTLDEIAAQRSIGALSSELAELWRSRGMRHNSAGDAKDCLAHIAKSCVDRWAPPEGAQLTLAAYRAMLAGHCNCVAASRERVAIEVISRAARALVQAHEEAAVLTKSAAKWA